MDGCGGGGSIPDSSKIHDLKPFGASPSGGAVFDASQYAFFGGDVVEEVELGGLEDEDDDTAPVEFEEEEFLLEKEEGDVFRSLSDIDDLSSTFSKLNKVASGPTGAGIGGDWGSRESSSAAEFAEDAGFNNWLDQRAFDTETIHESTRWPSRQFPPSAPFLEPKLLHRTSSYPEQQQPHPHLQQTLHHQNSSEPILIPKPPFPSYTPPGGGSQHASPNGQSSHSNNPYYSPITPSNLPAFPNSQPQYNALPWGPQFGGNLPHGLLVNSELQNQWMNQSGLHPGNQSSLLNNFSSQELPHQNGPLPPPLMPPQHSQQSRLQHPFQQSFGHLPRLQAQLMNPQLSHSPPVMNNMPGLPDLGDPRVMQLLRSRQRMHYSHQGSDTGGHRADIGWPRFRAKYMFPEEIENILRMQLAATHSSDPYVDDYYHQACLSRKTSGAKLRHHFCPVNLRDSFSRPRANNEPHSFLQVDALGRVSFSSIRRPRPLLEVDSSNSSGSTGSESKLSEKPLEQEPMLAARVTIEDGICLLLDVDDIDRYLQFNQLPDGGAQLRQRRQVLLEDLASSLHLVDPLGKNGDPVNLAPKDDIVFLRIVSLAKGRKLLLRYLQLLLPGELTRVACMGIFRNLRFLFGNIPADSVASLTTANLAKTVSSHVNSMGLKTLAACLASVVCSAEHPPMRTMGSPAGDGASVVLKSILERATELMTDPNTTANCTATNRAFWQASFDAFFSLLTKYCFNKYDSVVQSFIAQGSPDSGADVTKAISREMPIELLRASLPHTNEQQRKLLLEFAQRSMPVLGFNSQSGGNGNS